MNGDDAYYAENSSEMVEWMEKALLELYRSLEDCRSDCTSPLKKTTPTLGLSQVSQRGGSITSLYYYWKLSLRVRNLCSDRSISNLIKSSWDDLTNGVRV